MGASLPILPHYPYSDPTEFDFGSRAEGKRGRDQQVQEQKQLMSVLWMAVLKALGDQRGHAGVRTWQREGQEKLALGYYASNAT